VKLYDVAAQAIRSSGEAERVSAALREEVARLKNLPKRPKFKPSGMEKRTEAAKKKGTKPRRRGATKEHLKVDEVKFIRMPKPDGGGFQWILEVHGPGTDHSHPCG